MPTTSLVYPSHRLVVTFCSGTVALEELQASAAQIRDHPQFHPDFRQLINLAQATKLDLHFRDLYQIKHSADPFSNAGKRAVVAPTDVTFGISRMYQLILNSSHFEVFRSLDQAIPWLELDPSTIEDLLNARPVK